MTQSPNTSQNQAKLVTKLLDLPGSDQQSGDADPFKSLSWGESLGQANRPAASDYRPDGLPQWLEWIARGNDAQMEQALHQFEAHRPATAVPDLLQILTNRKIKEDNRHAALTALGIIGHPSAVPELLAQYKSLPIDLQKTLCVIMAEIADVRAVPFLLERSRDDFYEYRAAALFGIARVESPVAFSGLVQDSKTELTKVYTDDNSNPLQDSSSFGWAMLGAAISIWETDKWATRNATLMTNPYIPLDAVIEAPGEVRRLWLLHLRRTVLLHLVTVCGKEGLLACWPQAKQPIQRLMIAITMLSLYGPTDEYVNCLIESTKSRYMAERLLAYEEFIRLTAVTGNHTFHDWAQRGLQDKHKLLRGAVAAAILYSDVTSLMPQALEFARSKTADVRGSMVMPVVYAAVEGNASAHAVVQELLQDRDRYVRDYTASVWKLGQAILAESTPPLLPPSPVIKAVQPVPTPVPPAQTPISAHITAPPRSSTSPSFCMYCGQALRPSARFCAKCGQQIA